ncbi:DUF6192 family protein [Streptomyces sp. NPDC001415]
MSHTIHKILAGIPDERERFEAVHNPPSGGRGGEPRWTMRARRNARDYERLMSHAEAHIQWAFITLMSRRLARKQRRTEAATTLAAAA